MAFTEFDKQYGYTFHTYPIFAQEFSTEGGFKRFQSIPDPNDILQYALLGLPKYLPLTEEFITPENPIPVADYLTSAITEIEMDLGCDLSEVTRSHSEDYIDGMFSDNFMGMLLPRWPATQITQVQIKYPHTHNPKEDLYQTYTIPPSWLYLKRNKLNIVAAIGSVNVDTNSPNAATSGGLFTYVSGFARGAYQPGTIEVMYKAGFNHDKLPASVADLIKTWAAHRYLVDIAPMLFPVSNATVSVDGISQSTGFQIQQTLQTKVESLDRKKLELRRSFKKQFGRTVGVSFTGA